jgi:tetratricopeptide (TPR) repeat protein
MLEFAQKLIKNRIATGQKSCAFIVRVLAFAALIFVAVRSAAATAVNVEVMRIGDATHLEFSGSLDWKYELKRDDKKTDQVKLLLKGSSIGSAAKLKGIADALIKGVQVNEKAIDDSVEITFQVNDKTDFFDYISDQPTRLVVDFFPKENATADGKITVPKASQPEKPVASLPKKNASAKAVPHRASAKDEDAERTPAADGEIVARNELPLGPTLAEEISSKKDFSHGIFDGGDPEFKRFSIKDYEIKEDAITASHANFYLPFPMLELGVPQLKALLTVPPTYEVIPDENRENKEARVLLQLFNKKERALFMKAATEFLNSHPNSSYNEMIRYMLADAHYDIYRASNSVQDFETAMNSYLALTEKYPESPMVPRTLLLMGYSYLDRNDSFGALKIFQRFTRLFPNSKHINRVRLSIAEAYLHLNRFDDAYKLFDDLEKTATTEWGREEAAYRKGDVFFRNNDDVGAIREYKGAVKRFPAAANRFPNAWYNIAEAQFHQNDYRDSLDSYRSFLQKFPDHEHGGYAMTRMGELLGILGAPASRVEGAFMESYFRYRATPGAAVARIRLLSSRLPAMKEKEMGSALREIEGLTKKYANRPLTKKEIEEKKAAILAEAKKLAEEKKAEKGGEHGGGGGEHGGAQHAAAKEEDPEEAIASLDGSVISHLVPKEDEDATRRQPELPGIEEFSTLLIADGMSARRENDQAAQDLITYYQKNPQSVNTDKIKIRIVRNLADGIKTAMDKGDFMDTLRRYSKHADGWFKKTDRIDVPFDVGRAYEKAGVFKEAEQAYNESWQKLSDIKTAEAEREHRVFENLPAKDVVQLRLAAVTAAKGEYAQAETHLKKISGDAHLTESEQVERAELSAQVAEARGQSELARKYLSELIKNWKGNPEKTGPLHLRLARLEAENKNFKAAEQNLAQIISWRNQEGNVISDDLHAKALEMRADLHLKRGQRGDAIKAYRELLAAYEAKRPLESIRYRLGQLLFQEGDLKGAEGAWSELKSGKDSIWYRLATEQMQGAKWQNEYKKYLQRIPAAADLRGE